MAIPPRRTPRDRFFVGAGGPPVGGGGGAAPGIHTHVEADITDLDKYTQAAADAAFVDIGGDTMTGLLTVPGILSSLKITQESVSPNYRWIETDAASDEGHWEMRSVAGQFRFFASNDADSSENSVFEVDRTGFVVDNVNFLSTTLKHNGTVVSLLGHTHVEADITDLDKYTQAAADAKFVEVAGDTMTGDLVINQGSNVASRLVLGEQTVSRGSSQDGTIVMFGENADTTIDRWTLAATGVNFSFAHLAGDGALQLSADMDVLAGHFLQVRDSTNADNGKWTHDGTDFNLALTNTTDYNITGLTNLIVAGAVDVPVGSGYKFGGVRQLDVSGTDFNIRSVDTNVRITIANATTTIRANTLNLQGAAGATQYVVTAAAINPLTDGVGNLGTASLRFGTGYFDTDVIVAGVSVAPKVMTTNGDTVFFNSGYQRLAKGSDDQVLTLASGIPSWATPVSGFADPLTTDGDIMIRDTTTKRLAIGATGEVLSVSSGGIPEWAAAGSGGDHGALTGLLDDDHTQYAKLAGDTFTGSVIFTNTRTRLTNADPALIWTQTGATADEGVWRIVARTNQLRFGTLNDAESVAGNQMVFNRNGTAAQRVDIYGALRVLDLGETDHAEWTHDGTDLNLVLTNTTDYSITGSTHMFVDANLQVKGGNILRVLDAGGTDWGQIAHGGTNMTFSMVNTTNFVFSGITGNYGFEDGQILIDNLKSFRSINAATSGSISLVELDASDVGQFMIGGEAAEFGGNILPATGGTGFVGTAAKAWSDAVLETAHINILADASTFLHIGEASTLRGSAQRGNLRIWAETGAAAITQVTFQNTGSNLNITHQTGALQMGSLVDILSNKGLQVRDAGNTDQGKWTHDGTNFVLTLTNTSNYNITGITTVNISGIVIADEIRLAGDVELTSVRPTVRWEETDAAADNQVWDIRTQGEAMLFRALNDAGSVAANYMKVERTGTTIDSVDFPGTALTHGGTNVALEVMTTDGDILFYNSGRQRLAKGTNDQVLTLVAGLPAWAAGGGGGGSSITRFDPDANPNSAETEDDEFDETSLNARWTWVDQSSATVAVADDIARFGLTTNSGFVRRIQQSIPAGTTWRVRAKVLFTGPQASQSHVGIFMQDGTARLLWWGVGWSSTRSIFCFRFLNGSSFSSTAATYTFEGNESHRQWVYLEMERDGNDLSFRWSHNGLVFEEVHTETIANFILNAPDKFGCFVYKATTGISAEMFVDWFRYKGDLTTQMQGDQVTYSTP